MKKLLFVLYFVAAGTVFSQAVTPTPTETPTATATATATATPTATATGTPVPTPTPLSVIYRQDVQGQKKPLEMQQVDADRVTVTNDGPAAKVSGPQDVADSSFPTFTGIGLSYGGNIKGFSGSEFWIGKPTGGFGASNWLHVKDSQFLGLDNGIGEISFDTDSITDNRTYTLPDKDGTIAMLDDIPAAHNIVGETHFDPSGFPSVFGNIASVTVNSPGEYSIAFTTPYADANYGVTVTIRSGDKTETWTFNSFGEDENGFKVTTKKFSAGVLGVTLSSFTPTDPVFVTAVVYRNP